MGAIEWSCFSTLVRYQPQLGLPVPVIKIQQVVLVSVSCLGCLHLKITFLSNALRAQLSWRNLARWADGLKSRLLSTQAFYAKQRMLDMDKPTIFLDDTLCPYRIKLSMSSQKGVGQTGHSRSGGRTAMPWRRKSQIIWVSGEVAASILWPAPQRETEQAGLFPGSQ